MIELEFERNSEGAYILDPEIIQRSFKVTYNKNEVTGVQLNNNFWLDNGNVQVLAKTIPEWKGSYLMSVFGELLFSKFAEKNQIPCAEIDMGYYDGCYYTLSKNVLSPEEQKLSFRDLRKLCSKEDDYKFATIREAESLLVEYSHKFGVKIASKCFFKLKVMALIDFLVSQRDRNITNILFAVQDTPQGKVIDVKSFVDNENSFAFLFLLHRYNDFNMPQNSFLYKTTKKRRKINKLVGKAKVVGKDLALPVFGVKSTPRFDWETLNFREFFGEIFRNAETKKYKAKASMELAEEMKKDHRLYSLFKNTEFDADSCGREIFEETGICIPKQYLNLAQEIVNSRKKDLCFSLDKLLQSEMGG